MSDKGFVVTPMSDEFIQSKTSATKGVTVNGDDCPPFSEYKRTSTPNGVDEVVYDKGIGSVSGESDQF